MKKIIITLLILVTLIGLGVGGYFGYKYITEEPELSLKGLAELTLQANEKYEEDGITATYHEKDVSGDVEISGNVDTTKPGTYVITYKYTYGKDKAKELIRTVSVEDKEAPILKLKGKTDITMYTDEKYIEAGYTAQDNVDNNLDKQVKVEKKQINNSKYELIYSVIDSSGNKSTAKRTVNLKERPKPEVKEATTNTSTNTNTSSSSSSSSNANANTSTNTSTASKNNNSQTTTGPNNGIIYLTFDDGPSLDITPKMLDILKEEGVQATFFILNYDKNKEYLVKREANEGHSIGIHGYSHDYYKIYKSVDTYMNNVTSLQDKIKKTTGITTYITRFPGGSSNTVSSYNPGIMTKLTKEVVNRGFKYYDWNVSSGDAGGAKNKDQVYKNVTKGLKPNRSNVVLMHDFANNTKTLNALRAIIQYGKQNGYTFRTITKDTPMVTHGVNN